MKKSTRKSLLEQLFQTREQASQQLAASFLTSASGTDPAAAGEGVKERVERINAGPFSGMQKQMSRNLSTINHTLQQAEQAVNQTVGRADGSSGPPPEPEEPAVKDDFAEALNQKMTTRLDEVTGRIEKRMAMMEQNMLKIMDRVDALRELQGRAVQKAKAAAPAGSPPAEPGGSDEQSDSN